MMSSLLILVAVLLLDLLANLFGDAVLYRSHFNVLSDLAAPWKVDGYRNVSASSSDVASDTKYELTLSLVQTFIGNTCVALILLSVSACILFGVIFAHETSCCSRSMCCLACLAKQCNEHESKLNRTHEGLWGNLCKGQAS